METKKNYRNNIKHYEKSPNLAEIEIRYKMKPLEKAKITSSKMHLIFFILYITRILLNI